ncbi:MAG: bifunctional phosphopantothenoylcysteine decarboxylase/phosphopantothenate--cysteine ligase CoaBC [Chloroflexota bacterium]|nr:bifunctional phosphopantothenoylcysteine decarboxylase/phosphopantothenate--cysteine ligase CoaBC [Chloroflexota bacterium]
MDGKRIVLGVSGGIAAYKVADLASRLVQAGALVDVVLTASAQRFVTPLTFQAITRRPVRTDLYADWLGDDTGHVGLAHNAHLLVIAPATAHSIARLALGLSDDLLCAIYLSTRAPLLLVPAMETGMYMHKATQEHLDLLRQRGAEIMEPGEGRLASGAVGVGRLPEVPAIIAAVEAILTRSLLLLNKRVVITAGGTHEAIDPVRYVGNRSSGKMGYALAEAAREAGAEVTLISGPVSMRVPHSINLVRVESALEMEGAVSNAVQGADALIMAAAVADYAPMDVSEQKIKKTGETLTLVLKRNPDILAGLAQRDLPGLIRVGFAAETEDLLENARGKLRSKRLDMIVANDAVSSIGADSSALSLVMTDGTVETLNAMPKEQSARLIIGRLARLFAEAEASAPHLS